MVEIEPILLQTKPVAHNKQKIWPTLSLSEQIQPIQANTITRTSDDDGSSRGACVDRTDRNVVDACDDIDSE